MGRKLKSYLEWANFNIIRNTPPKYKVPLLIDLFVALFYTVTSIVLICVQEASKIVYLLNILCLLRAILSNVVNASKVTDSKREVEVNKKHEGNSHYHHKVYILGPVFLMAMLLLVLLLKEPSDAIIKTLTSICIAVVFINDCEDMVVCAYGAEINMKERT